MDKGADWLRANTKAISKKVGILGVTKPWANDMIAYFVPVRFNPISQIEELLQTNTIAEGVLLKARWAKLVHWYNKDQAYAHLIISYADKDAANTVMMKELHIGGKWVMVACTKKEPIQCLK
ncbi:hypothetical protein DXG03_002376, partial [Asterophora parasitica]